MANTNMEKQIQTVKVPNLYTITSISYGVETKIENGMHGLRVHNSVAHKLFRGHDAAKKALIDTANAFLSNLIENGHESFDMDYDDWHIYMPDGADYVDVIGHDSLWHEDKVFSFFLVPIQTN